jgi:hypothetical protein
MRRWIGSIGITASLRRTIAGIGGLAAALGIASQGGAALDVRLNEVQVLGSHNSYHIQPAPELIEAYLVFDPAATALEYTHRPLGEQLEELGIRQIELDIYADPLGGLFADPLALEALAGMPVHVPELDVPGLKVIHIADIDVFSTCSFFVECLLAVKTWSDANPNHLPIVILVETKTESFLTETIPFGPAELDTVDAEIRSVFPEDQILTPDDVRGGRATLEEAIRKDGWPTLREARGQVLFALDNGGGVRDAYLEGYPGLEGRVLFVDSRPGDDVAAFAKLNDPVGDYDLIRKLVKRGFLVRTRADADTEQARTGDTTDRDAALASGAQFVSTDYPELGPFGTDYIVELPGGGPGRCNPVSAPKECADRVLENLTALRPLAGRRLALRDRAGDPSKRKLGVVAKDVAVETPLPGSADDPSLAGASLVVSNPDTGESALFALPGGAAWRGIGKPPGRDGWVYRDPQGLNGPCALLEVRNGAGLRAACTGAKGGDIPFSLDEASQERLDVTLQLGAGALHCLRFGGQVVKDTSTASVRTASFIARAAPATACPI